MPFKRVGNACAPGIYMFPVPGQAGALGSRASVNARCSAAAANYPFPYSQAVAFISFSADDEIRDLPSTAGVPTDRAIVGWRKSNALGGVVANNWTDLLDGSIQRNFVQAGIYNDQDLSNFNDWFSGSNSDGSLGSNCSGWQPSADNTNAGNYGNPYQTDSKWIGNMAGRCGGTYDLLCIAFTP